MPDARTKIEFLYQEVLRDIHVLLTHVDEIKNTVPAEINAAAENLKAAAATMQSTVTAAETERLQIAFTKVAEAVLQDIRREAHAAAPSAWKIKVAVSMTLVIALSGLAGFVAGHWNSYPANNPAQEAQLAAGKDFLSVLPLLDTGTREKIARLIESK